MRQTASSPVHIACDLVTSPRGAVGEWRGAASAVATGTVTSRYRQAAASRYGRAGGCGAEGRDDPLASGHKDFDRILVPCASVIAIAVLSHRVLVVLDLSRPVDSQRPEIH